MGVESSSGKARQGSRRGAICIRLLLPFFIWVFVSLTGRPAFATPRPAAGDEISVRATVDADQISQDDQLTLSVIIEGATRGVEVEDLPRLDGLSVVSGPSIGQQSSISLINGRLEQKSSLTYTYILLPEREGTLTIPSLKITYDGKTYQTGDLRVVVSGSAPAPPGPRSRPVWPPAARAPREPAAEDRSTGRVFVRAVLGKERAHAGEGVPLEYRVYTQQDVAEFGFQKEPHFEGFWVEKVPEQPRMKRERVGEEEYGWFTAARYVLYATAPGTYTLPAQTLSVTLVASDFFSLFNRQQQVLRRSDPLTLEIAPLPPGAPAAFSGAVGEYTFSAGLDKGEAAAGDAVSLKVRVEGLGNLRGLSPPVLPPLPDFKVYEPEAREEIRATARDLEGERRWEYVLVPRAPGEQTIPPLRFAWFSPQSGTYRTAASEPLVLNVLPGQAAGGGGPAGGGVAEEPARTDVRQVEEDIRFIRSAPARLADQGARRIGAGWTGAALLLPALGNLLAFLVVRAKRMTPGERRMVRRKLAARSALGRLGRARRHARGGDAVSFYPAVDEALRGFLADRLALPGAAGLTLERMRTELAARGVEEEVAGRLVDCLERCDFARFAPAGSLGRPEMSGLLDEAGRVLRELARRL